MIPLPDFNDAIHDLVISTWHRTPNTPPQQARPRDHGARAAVRVSQLISAHARIALPNSGGMVLSDLLIIAVASNQFAVNGYDEGLGGELRAAGGRRHPADLGPRVDRSPRDRGCGAVRRAGHAGSVCR